MKVFVLCSGIWGAFGCDGAWPNAYLDWLLNKVELINIFLVNKYILIRYHPHNSCLHN